MDDLIKSNTGLVHWQAKRFAWCGAAYDDLVQEGMLGLLIAAQKFDPTRGVKFSTYATWWVRQRIGRCADKHIKDTHQSLDQQDDSGRRKVDLLTYEPKPQTSPKAMKQLAMVMLSMHPRERRVLKQRLGW